VSAVVDRLRRTRSLPWLRVIDEAQLDEAAELEADAEAVVAPYRWLLERVGDGVRLTQAGYLPPTIVKAAMQELGWLEKWIGTASREVETPVLELRESAQRFGLLRKTRGRLFVTKVGRSLLNDPPGLWWHLASRLPDGRSQAEREAGVLYLLTVAAGKASDDSLLALGMSLLGWTADGITPITDIWAFSAAEPTRWLFLWLRLVPDGIPWGGGPRPLPTDEGRRLARAALLGRTGPATAADPAPRPKADRAVQLLVALSDITPPIWRRLVVPASLTFRDLHDVIQIAMGWQSYHLHLFDVEGVRYGDVEDLSGPLGEEEEFTVGEAASAISNFTYEYDFGDGWMHEIRVEQVMASVGSGTPHLLDGARACPPEDCGGPGGYQHLLKVLAHPAHREHQTVVGWLGGGFNSEELNLEEANANLEVYDRQTRQRRVPPR
jgi:hypothetical protein